MIRSIYMIRAIFIIIVILTIHEIFQKKKSVYEEESIYIENIDFQNKNQFRYDSYDSIFIIRLLLLVSSIIYF